MAASPARAAEKLSLDDLVAFNDEIAALARAGVPLELGLRTGRGRLPRRLSRLIARIAERLERGASLEEAVVEEEQEGRLPGVYGSVVRAGLKTERLAEALEGLSSLGSSLADLRRRIALAAIYPSIVLLGAYALFVLFVVFMVPRLEAAFTHFGVRAGTMMERLVWLGETAEYWGPLLPAALVVLAIAWRSSELPMLAPTQAGAVRFGYSSLFGWLPWVRPILANARCANVADLLALLIEHGVPLPESLRVAGQAAGSRWLAQAAAATARDVEAGRSFAQSVKEQKAFPPFLRSMMSTPGRESMVVSALRQAGELYRRRAAEWADWCAVILPGLLLVIVGGGTVLVYALTFFLPLLEMLEGLAGAGETI